MRERWVLKVRSGPRVERQTFASLREALDALDERVAALMPGSQREEIRFLSRRIEPVKQVAARVELSGRGGFRASVHAGVDVRGDGSAEAYTGKLQRTVIERRHGESAPAALRRALAT